MNDARSRSPSKRGWWRAGKRVYMPVVMPTVTGTRANVARAAGTAPKRPSVVRRRTRKKLAVLPKNAWASAVVTAAAQLDVLLRFHRISDMTLIDRCPAIVVLRVTRRRLADGR